MSTKGRVKVGGASTCVDSSVPYSTITRRERSRKLAQKRRDTYKHIMEDLTGVLPFPNDIVSQLDYNSRLRLAVCFFRLKTMTDSEDDVASYTSGGEDHSPTDSRKQIVKKKFASDKKLSSFQPGMLQDLMSEALDGFMMVIQMDGTVVFLSESVHKHLGLFQSEYIGMTVYDLMLEEDYDDVRKKISEAEAKSLTRTTKLGATRIGFFCRMKCSRSKVANTITRSPGYKLVYVSGTLKVSKDEPFIACIVHPVSPPSILELRMEGNMFVTHYTMDMTCIFFDGRLRQLLGYTKDDLVGTTPFNQHHHEDTEATLQCSRGVMARGEGLSGYYRFLSQFGEYIWLQTRATLMHDSRTGQPSYIVCMNFIIGKEDGDKDLQLRQAITSGDSKISSDADHAHDPFPLNEREDGKVVNPLQGKGNADGSTIPLNVKQEEPTSTVEAVVSNEEGFSSPDCVSPDLGEVSGTDSTPSVTVSASSDSVPSMTVSASPDSIPSVAVRASPEIKESPQSHSMSNTETASRSNSSSSSSTIVSSSSSPLSNTQTSSSQIKTSSNNFENCLPDSTTQSVSSSVSSQPASRKSKGTKHNHSVNSDQGYHSISSSTRGGQLIASIGNESELSGNSSHVFKSSPESSLYPPFSPDYPQSVFSSDGSLPPPSNHTVLRVDSPESSSQPAATVIHHPNSHVMTPVKQVTPLKPVIPMMPVKQVMSTHQMPLVDQYGVHASSMYPQQFVHGQPIHGDHFIAHDVQMQASHQQNYTVIGNEGGNPASVFPNWNTNQMGMTFVKAEPTSPPYYTPPYIGGSVPQPQGAAAIFTGPQGISGFPPQSGSSLPVGTQMLLSHQQPNNHSLIKSGSPMFTTSAAGVSSSYQAGNPTNGRAAPSDLPQLTGEDLRMLDTFDQTRLPGEGNHFCGSAQPQLPPATLNYHGNVLM